MTVKTKHITLAFKTEEFYLYTINYTLKKIYIIYIARNI